MTPDKELLDFSRSTMAKGSKSFARAAMLFDKDIRDDVMMLYAWCRHCDDVIDGQSLGHHQTVQTPEVKKLRAEDLRARTVAAFHGEADTLPFRALQYVAQKHAFDLRHPLELIEGFEMDAENRTFETIEDTMLYSYHVAGVVGIMMARIMGVKDSAVLERAADLGIAFQLTNIARDVQEDAAAGRIFLPLLWLKELGIPLVPECFTEDVLRPGLHTAAVRLVETAEPFYASARLGVAELPYRSAWAIAAALSIYRDIGFQVKRQGGADGRAMTSGLRKLWHLARSAVAAGVAVGTRPDSHPVRTDLWKRKAA